MLKIRPYYEGIQLPPEYAPLIHQRNGRLAIRLGSALGMPASEEAPVELSRTDYPLLPVPYPKEQLPNRRPEQFYGAIVKHAMHGTKAMLQAAIRPDDTPEHLPEGLEALHALRLKGYLAFNEDQARKAFHALQKEGFSVRVKNPEESDGNGQIRVESIADLNAALVGLKYLFHQEIGVVLEANIDPLEEGGQLDTYTVGRVLLPNGKVVHFAGKQIDLEDRDGFGGIDMHVGYGPVEQVMRAALPRFVCDTLKGIGDGFALLGQHLSASRLSVDCLHGRAQGIEIAGACDLTTRVGGTCPGIVEALHAIQEGGTELATAHVKLHWNPTGKEVGTGFRYIDDPRLIITASARAV